MDRATRRYLNGLTFVASLIAGATLLSSIVDQAEPGGVLIFAGGLGVIIYVGVYAYQSGIVSEL